MRFRKAFCLLLVAGAMASGAIILQIPAAEYQTALGDSLALAATQYESGGPYEAVALIDATFAFASATDPREVEVELNVLVNGIPMVYAGIIRVVPVGEQLRGSLVLPVNQGVAVIGAPGAVASTVARIIVPIPEPGTWLLAGLPLLIALMRRRYCAVRNRRVSDCAAPAHHTRYRYSVAGLSADSAILRR